MPKPTPEEVAKVHQLHAQFNDLLDVAGRRLDQLSILSARGDEETFRRLHTGFQTWIHDELGHGQENLDLLPSFVSLVTGSLRAWRARVEEINQAAMQAHVIMLPAFPKSVQDRMIPLLELLSEDSAYTTGTGQDLVNVHPREDCEGWCVIHDPVPGPWTDWPTNWSGDGPFDIWRGMERICPHGVRHPAAEEILHRNRGLTELQLIPHACCGCPCTPAACDSVFSDGPDGELIGFVIKQGGETNDQEREN